jgi:hypothetical protein
MSKETFMSLMEVESTVVVGCLGLNTVNPKMSKSRKIKRITAAVTPKQMFLRLCFLGDSAFIAAAFDDSTSISFFSFKIVSS